MTNPQPPLRKNEGSTPNFERIQAIFDEACDLPEAQRQLYLEHECAGDASLRLRVEGLLREHDDDSPAFPTPVTGDAQQLANEIRRLTGDSGGSAVAGGMPARIGPYRLQAIIGEGGSSFVYRAERETAPRRVVALKVLKQVFGTTSMRERFIREAEALALLSHPRIANVYEVSVVDWLPGSDNESAPYLALELIDGVTIMEFVRTHTLGIPERLRLIIEVCEAVQHAHQKGVIHRDLKPANIMVDGEGHIKVLDFGIARLTNSDVQAMTSHTSPGELLGTIPYMSPEQVSGDPRNIDTRSDIYAIGVLLHEVLADNLPYGARGMPLKDLLDAIQIREPIHLSEVNPELRGDIETIALKALEKEPQKRYQSAAELSADISNFLNDQPISARSPSTLYQLRKLVRRHRSVSLLSAALLLVLVVACVVSGLLAIGQTRALRHASQSALEARENLQITESALEFVNRDLVGTLNPYGHFGIGQTVTVLEAVDLAEKSLSSQIRPAFIEASIRGHLGNMFDAIGEPGRAEPNLRRALDLYRTSLGDHHRMTILAQESLAALLVEIGRSEEAKPMLIDVRVRAAREFGPDSREELRISNVLAICFEQLGEAKKAEDMYRETLSRSTKFLGPQHSTTLDCQNDLATFLAAHSRFDEAELLLKASIEFTPRQAGPTRNLDSIKSEMNLAALYADSGRSELALAMDKTLFDSDMVGLPANHPYRLMLMLNLAGVYMNLEKLKDAEPLLDEVLPRLRQTLGASDPHTLNARSQLAGVYAMTGRVAKAIEMNEALLKDAGTSSPFLPELHANYGAALLKDGQFAQAEKVLLDSYDKLVAGERPGASEVVKTLIELYDAMGKPDKTEYWRLRLLAPKEGTSK